MSTAFSGDMSGDGDGEGADGHTLRRHEWGAAPAKYQTKFDAQTKPTVRFAFTNTKKCDTWMSCTRIVQKLQKDHLDLGYPDIQYNFLVGGDGNVYEGAGWQAKVRDIARPAEENPEPAIIIGYVCSKDDAKESLDVFEKKGNEFVNWAKEKTLVQ